MCVTMNNLWPRDRLIHGTEGSSYVKAHTTANLLWICMRLRHTVAVPQEIEKVLLYRTATVCRTCMRQTHVVWMSLKISDWNDAASWYLIAHISESRTELQRSMVYIETTGKKVNMQQHFADDGSSTTHATLQRRRLTSCRRWTKWWRKWRRARPSCSKRLSDRSPDEQSRQDQSPVYIGG